MTLIAITTPDGPGLDIRFSDGDYRTIETGTDLLSKTNALREAGYELVDMWELDRAAGELTVEVRRRSVQSAVAEALFN